MAEFIQVPLGTGFHKRMHMEVKVWDNRLPK